MKSLPSHCNRHWGLVVVLFPLFSCGSFDHRNSESSIRNVADGGNATGPSTAGGREPNEGRSASGGDTSNESSDNNTERPESVENGSEPVPLADSGQVNSPSANDPDAGGAQNSAEGKETIEGQEGARDGGHTGGFNEGDGGALSVEDAGVEPPPMPTKKLAFERVWKKLMWDPLAREGVSIFETIPLTLYTSEIYDGIILKSVARDLLSKGMQAEDRNFGEIKIPERSELFPMPVGYILPLGISLFPPNQALFVVAGITGGLEWTVFDRATQAFSEVTVPITIGDGMGTKLPGLVHMEGDRRLTGNLGKLWRKPAPPPIVDENDELEYRVPFYGVREKPAVEKMFYIRKPAFNDSHPFEQSIACRNHDGIVIIRWISDSTKAEKNLESNLWVYRERYDGEEAELIGSYDLGALGSWPWFLCDDYGRLFRWDSDLDEIRVSSIDNPTDWKTYFRWSDVLKEVGRAAWIAMLPGFHHPTYYAVPGGNTHGWLVLYGQGGVEESDIQNYVLINVFESPPLSSPRWELVFEYPSDTEVRKHEFQYIQDPKEQSYASRYDANWDAVPDFAYHHRYKERETPESEWKSGGYEIQMYEGRLVDVEPGKPVPFPAGLPRGKEIDRK